MTMMLDTVYSLLLLSNLMLLGSSRLLTQIRLIALQGVLLGVQCFALPHGMARGIILGSIVILLKGGLFPKLLVRALRESNAHRELEPLVGYTLSFLFGIIALGAAAWISSLLTVPGVRHVLVFPAALTTILTGMFLIVSRRKALPQLIGFIALENGIFITSMALLSHIPLMVELSVLLDVFAAVLVMGIAICHINREFDHIDTDQMDTLKG